MTPEERAAKVLLILNLAIPEPHVRDILITTVADAIRAAVAEVLQEMEDECVYQSTSIWSEVTTRIKQRYGITGVVPQDPTVAVVMDAARRRVEMWDERRILWLEVLQEMANETADREGLQRPQVKEIPS